MLPTRHGSGQPELSTVCAQRVRWGPLVMRGVSLVGVSQSEDGYTVTVTVTVLISHHTLHTHNYIHGVCPVPDTLILMHATPASCAHSYPGPASRRAPHARRAPFRCIPTQRSREACESASARSSAASKINPPRVATACVPDPSEPTSCYGRALRSALRGSWSRIMVQPHLAPDMTKRIAAREGGMC